MKKVIFISLLTLVVVFGFSSLTLAEDGVTDTEIVVGSHQDLSGPIAGWGTQVKIGLEMKAREINEAGGIHGRKIRLVIEDSAYDPKKAIMVTNKMINLDKVFAFVGNMGSPTAGATKPIISRKKIPQMFPLTAASLFFGFIKSRLRQSWQSMIVSLSIYFSDCYGRCRDLAMTSMFNRIQIEISSIESIVLDFLLRFFG